MLWLIIVILLILCLGGLPTAPWAGWHSYGYAPSGILGLVLVIFLVLILFGRY